MDPKLQKIMDMDSQHFMYNFGKRTPVCFTSGTGSTLTDTAGKTYLDLIGGIAVNVLGHAHPRLTRAICDQAGQLLHCSNLYYIENQALLATRLTQIAGLDRAFFSNSGAEANEAAFKLARGYFYHKGTPRTKVISTAQSFHGRTLSTLAATGQPKYQKPFLPMPAGFVQVPYNDIEAMKNEMDDHTCAVILELILGESGVYPADQAYAEAVAALCRENGALLIIDEIQTGMGRTGKMFAYQHYGIKPDIVTLAKGLAGGLPIGACLATENAASGFQPGDHGTTFGGGPLVCAGALAVLDEYEASDLVAEAHEKGVYFRSLLADDKALEGRIDGVRGLGLMIGIQLHDPVAQAVKQQLMDKGFLVNAIGEHIIRLLPPLVITHDELARFHRAFTSTLVEGSAS